jgi:hypothetical protein
MQVWIYNQPYLRFAMAKFDLNDTGNRFAHLCNNCVQREDEGFALEGGNESMWTLAQVRSSGCAFKSCVSNSMDLMKEGPPGGEEACGKGLLLSDAEHRSIECEVESSDD